MGGIKTLNRNKWTKREEREPESEMAGFSERRELLGKGKVCCQKKWLHHRRSARQKCNHGRDEMMRGSGDGGRGWAEQMSAPEDENEIDERQTRPARHKLAACEGPDGGTSTHLSEN